MKAKLLLSERVVTCESCGHVADRDDNAAFNRPSSRWPRRLHKDAPATSHHQPPPRRREEQPTQRATGPNGRPL